jgi:hypothetical protein
MLGRAGMFCGTLKRLPDIRSFGQRLVVDF